MNKLLLLPLLLPLVSCGYNKSHIVHVLGTSVDGQTLFSEEGSFRLAEVQPFLKEGQTCTFEALGEVILLDTLQCQ